MRLLGLDPGLRITGWGIIDIDGNRMSYIADGAIKTNAKLPLAERLVQLYEGIEEVIKRFGPIEAAVEETFVNKNPNSTLKLGQARGVVMLTPARAGLNVCEYTPNQVKKTVVGAGHAQKEQVQMMVKTLLPAAKIENADAADALAVAICHAQHRNTPDKWGALK
ncbi:component of RuvABC resolvasome, endonuclease [Candidatus Terasakiella magnetica]|uniref:Crossover junction endodeoxyribonuclease RuvC n=1 Tax=Candidatus Terasakiella magnetica TaxID=1867952 RepID=A0A1C3RHQ4_9PROT|nr:crossover junction endodeoxyribonuclease RuvC [Candidatus Terasakiella magnetica]SCA56795.1 component of RuvABC resolvasome, endonuclease [Candidatus Terasakiella magnetica]